MRRSAGTRGGAAAEVAQLAGEGGVGGPPLVRLLVKLVPRHAGGGGLPAALLSGVRVCPAIRIVGWRLFRVRNWMRGLNGNYVMEFEFRKITQQYSVLVLREK